MKKDLVSIVTASYNCEQFISETIQSVISQTYTNWELLIIDDNSSDNSVAIIKEFSQIDTRIQLFQLKINQGAAKARNVGIEKSTGEFIAFLDSDDVWLPQKLTLQIAFMKKNNFNFTHTSYFFMDESSRVLTKIYSVKKKLSYKNMLYTNSIGCLSVVLNQSKMGKLFMPNMRKRQDYAHWLSILKSEPFAYGLEEPLAKYRIRKNSMSANKIEMLKWNFNLFYKNQKLPWFRAIYYVLCNVFIKITE